MRLQPRRPLQRTERRPALKPDWLAADTAYGTGKFLGWLVDAGITPHIPVWEKAKRDQGTFPRGDFTFDKEKNEYTCPSGKALRTTGKVHDGRRILYRASKFNCEPYPLKPKCCPKAPGRKVPRDVNEAARDIARALMGYAGVRDVARLKEEGRDAMRAPKDPSSLRAPASSGAHRRA
jgi:hypothetical protein